jgi:hypothetical protein
LTHAVQCSRWPVDSRLKLLFLAISYLNKHSHKIIPPTKGKGN